MKRMILVVALLSLPCAMQAQTPQERMDAAMGRAAAAGLPAALIRAKIAEGMAKGVPPERLAAAIDRREAALERAYAAMAGSGNVEADQLSVGADALSAGVSEAVLTQLSETADGRRRVVAIAALTQLVASGQVPEQALDQVTGALARGGDALANLPARAAEAAARSGPFAGVGGPASVGAPTGLGGPQVPAGVPAGVPAPGRRPGLGPDGNRPPGVSGGLVG